MREKRLTVEQFQRYCEKSGIESYIFDASNQNDKNRKSDPIDYSAVFRSVSSDPESGCVSFSGDDATLTLRDVRKIVVDDSSLIVGSVIDLYIPGGAVRILGEFSVSRVLFG